MSSSEKIPMKKLAENLKKDLDEVKKKQHKFLSREENLGLRTLEEALEQQAKDEETKELVLRVDRLETMMITLVEQLTKMTNYIGVLSDQTLPAYINNPVYDPGPIAKIIPDPTYGPGWNAEEKE